ncbi:hypothetical protein H5410_058197 [Solanum commersonii]|uniref:Uncharacterized protein n=1 Tax=Solanum commersonii TaxID=4109 RepID=A0A9J5WS30_SOLCO|nr:hypothetical protein H5410_058197 [Solanum commersonii]
MMIKSDYMGQGESNLYDGQDERSETKIDRTHEEEVRGCATEKAKEKQDCSRWSTKQKTKKSIWRLQPFGQTGAFETRDDGTSPLHLSIYDQGPRPFLDKPRTSPGTIIISKVDRLLKANMKDLGLHGTKSLFDWVLAFDLKAF